MDEKDVFTRYLQAWDGKDPWKSSLDGALRDARVTMEHGEALSPATLDEHEADTFAEHEFVNMLSPWSSSLAL